MNNVLHVSILIETISSALTTDGEYKSYIIRNTLNYNVHILTLGKL